MQNRSISKEYFSRNARRLKLIPGFLRRKWRHFIGLPIESPAKTFCIALLVSICAGFIVSVSNVLLKPIELKNKEKSQRAYLLQVFDNKNPIQQMISFDRGKNVEIKIVNLSTGKYSDSVLPEDFDQIKAVRDPLQSTDIPPNQDIAHLKRRANHALVYIVGGSDRVRYVILPVYGKGYISTLYGYLGLDLEKGTVIGLSFYQHGETPGLGGRVNDRFWLDQWRGKKIRDRNGRIRLGVSRGIVPENSTEFEYRVDGLSGATKTSMGVHGLLRFWLGEWGYGPFLNCLKTNSC